MFETLKERIVAHLELVYPDENLEVLYRKIIDAFFPDDIRPRSSPHTNNKPHWSERDAVLITYGDSIKNKDNKPLEVLDEFLTRYLTDTISSVHILPFFPFSSDDGFAVIDYEEVNTKLGGWKHIREIASRFKLMSDLVLNHASSQHRWFHQFIEGKQPGRDYIKTAELDDDLSQVVRPRPHPLLRPTETTEGMKQVWCTFSHDQVDLDFSNPDMLVEFLRILRMHITQGVRIVRLDAVAFLWKKPGSSSIHLPQTHEIIRLMRTLVNFDKERVVLITETNVPNQENLSYFGNQNEAHVIYNFSLPPLMVHALLTGKSDYLKKWQMGMPPAAMGTTYLNFTASHDGIGQRPVEGLLDDDEVKCMHETIKSFGGLVSMRKTNDGGEKPYELNVSLFDALKGTVEGEDEWQIERFLCSQTIMMGLEGIPAFYIHSLLATPNDYENVERTRHNRSINRHSWDYQSLQEKLADQGSSNARVFNELRRRIAIRVSQAAFHPNATQFTLHLGSELFGFWRQSIDRSQSIFCISNMTKKKQDLELHNINLINGEEWKDLLSGDMITSANESVPLKPYQTVWISNKSL